jgi:aminopeptidase
MENSALNLAKIIVEHSLQIKQGDKFLIDASDFTAEPLIREVYRRALQLGAHVYLDIMGMSYANLRADQGGYIQDFLRLASKEQLSFPQDILKYKIDWADKFFRIVSIHDPKFLSNIDQEQIITWQKNYYPELKNMIKKPWLLTYFPTIGMANAAGMTLDEFMEFYYQACTIDYKDLARSIYNLQNILDNGREVHICGKGIDLHLGVEGRLAQGTDCGKHNIPDGECFIAPIENMTNGYVDFEYPQIYQGTEVEGIHLAFENGRVVDVSAEKNQVYLDLLLNSHPGNKILGEFGIGMNRNIRKYIKQIIFDEKIYGTVHFALGSSYEDQRGGGKNVGNIHWDLIKDLRHAGSFIRVDGKDIFRDGEIIL